MTKRKKLLQINTTANYGSHGRIAEEIGLLAMESGWESYIAFGRYERPGKSQLIKIGNQWDIKLHGLKTRLFDKHGLGSTKATRSLVHRISGIKPDVIHLHNIHGYYLNYKVLFKYLASVKTPVIWTLHDCWAFTGHCAYFDFAGCDKWKTQCYQCPQKRRYPASYLMDASKSNYILKRNLFNAIENLTIIPVSNWLTGLVRESFLGIHPIRTIHNGIDTKVFKPPASNDYREKRGLDNYFLILGVASVWEERKGFDDFIKLSEKLDDKFKIILVGLNEKQIKQLPQNIIGFKRTDSITELVDLYASADVFVNPTWEDNFPTTNLEALACGTPVITYKTGGSIEAINESTGYVIDKGDILNLEKAIKEVQTLGKKFYATACRERAMNYFDKMDRYNEYIQLYDSLTFSG